jgi:hypothetical protein
MQGKTEWKVEGNGPATKITAYCPVCKTGNTFVEIQVDEFAHLRRVARLLRRFRTSGWPIPRDFSRGRRVWFFLSVLALS